MSPSRLFILRPVATSLLMLAIVLVGVVAYRQLPVSALPQVDYPTIQVLTFYPGASPDVMASSVTAPLERQFGQVVMATILIRASGSGVRSRASRGSAVVVMEPPENRDSRDAALELGRTRNRLLLRESLVRTRLVVEAHELGDEASEVVLAEEEDVVEQLPAQGAREPFGERVHVRCLGCNPHDTRP